MEDVSMMTVVRSVSLLFFFLFSSLAWSVNINTADANALATELKGVGAKKAEAIVQYRKEHGPFKSVDELLKVKGVGPALLEKNKSNISVKDKAS
jgi:competence ComEA-like helix-hairpin-helix protein